MKVILGWERHRAAPILGGVLLGALLVAGVLPRTALADPLFPNPVLPVGETPVFVAVGDFNGDGRTDLAVANDYSSDVSVLLGNGDGTFADPMHYAAGAQPLSIAVGDFNGDGRLDLAVANHQSNDVSVLLGNGDGTFGAQARFATGNGPVSVAVGDFNGDGRSDLAVANVLSNDVSVLLGKGDGTFRVELGFNAGFYPGSVAVGDFNADGRPDLAVANRGSDDVSVLLGNGDGTFGAQARFPIGSLPGSVAVGDFNGDGRPDLAVANVLSNDVSVLLGKGDGTFGVQLGFTTGYDPGSVAVGDFNGDGHPDLVVANAGQYGNAGDVSVLLGKGDGTLFRIQARFAAGVGPISVAVGDFNGDGRPDLVVANYQSNDISVLPGNGDGTFGGHASFATGYVPYTVAVGDFNGDGRPDLAVANEGGLYDNGDVSVLLGKGDGTFGVQAHFAAGVNPESVAAGDFNGDARLDLAVVNIASNDVSVLLGNGDGTFADQLRYAAGAEPLFVAVSDFNGDGRPDLAVANFFDVAVLLGNGDGTFADPVHYAAGAQPHSVVVGDFNGDGHPDLAVANQQSNDVSVLLGNGDGTFGTQTRFMAGAYPSSVAVGDFNGDGRPDLAVANRGDLYGIGDVSVLLGKGDGTFGVQARFAAGFNPSSVAAEDFNGDGRPDLAVTNYFSNDVLVLVGNGDGTFGAQAGFATGYSPASVAVGDFNADGRPDLAVTIQGWYFNAGDVSVLLNQGPYPNRPPIAVAKAGSRVECTSSSGATVTLDGSASSDPDSTSGTNDDIKKFEWYENLGAPYQTNLGNGQLLAVTLALGTHVVTLKVTDSHGASATAQVTVTVVDTTPPAVVCPFVSTAECAMPGGAAVGLMATATDACSQTLSITNIRTGAGADASGFYPLGLTGVVFTASDASGNTATCASSVVVRDTVPPSLTLTLSPATLWPPNHRLVPVQTSWQVSDVCDSAAGVVLAAAMSSEPDDVTGSGGTTGDIQDASIGTPDISVLLRAERSEDGPGRVYTLTYVATDSSGNSTTTVGLVTVPYDLGPRRAGTSAKRRPGPVSKRLPLGAEPGRRP